jgi:hypothetical protein
MKSKDKFLKGYAAGKDAYLSDAEIRPFWDRLAFAAALVSGSFIAEKWLAHHTSLSEGLRYATAIVVPCLFAVPCSLLMGRLRKLSGR